MRTILGHHKSLLEGQPRYFICETDYLSQEKYTGNRIQASSNHNQTLSEVEPWESRRKVHDSIHRAGVREAISNTKFPSKNRHCPVTETCDITGTQ